MQRVCQRLSLFKIADNPSYEQVKIANSYTPKAKPSDVSSPVQELATAPSGKCPFRHGKLIVYKIMLVV